MITYCLAHLQNAATQEVWRMGADSFRLSTAMGVDGKLTMSTAALLKSEAAWSIKEGGMLARQLSKLQFLMLCSCALKAFWSASVVRAAAEAILSCH